MQTKISKLFRDTREIYGLSQSDFSKLIPCSRVSLSMYETGKTQPSADKYTRVLELFSKQTKQSEKNVSI